MALIICPECGKKFSDKAPACPECGCPIEYILNCESQDDNDSVQAEQQVSLSTRESDNNNDDINVYSIFGEEIKFSEKLEKHFIWKAGVSLLLNEYLKIADDMYYSAGNLDDLLESVSTIMPELLDKLLDKASNALVSNGIYNLDKEHFYAKYRDTINACSIIEPIIDKYMTLLDYEDQVESYHEYVKTVHRNSWSGGGLGITGALKGVFQAELLNVGTSFLHSFSDNAERRKDMQAIAIAKKKLYESDWTHNSIASAFATLYVGVIGGIEKELVNAGVYERYDFRRDDAISIINNINISIRRKEIDGGRMLSMLKMAFTCDPTYYPTYQVSFMLDLDYSGDLKKIAEKLGYYQKYLADNRQYKKKKLNSEISSLENKSVLSTDEEVLSFFKECSDFEKQNDYDLTELYVRAINSRANCAVSPQSAEIIIDAINDITDYRPGSEDSLREEEKERLITTIRTKSKEYNPKYDNPEINRKIEMIIKGTCEKYAFDYDRDNSFYFDAKCDIKNSKIFEYLEIALNLPRDETIYMAYTTNTGREDSGLTDAIAVTNNGVYFKDVCLLTRRFYSWSDYAKAKVSIESYDFCVNNEQVISHCKKTLRSLLLEIHESIDEYYRTGESDTSVSDVDIVEMHEHEDADYSPHEHFGHIDCSIFIKEFCHRNRETFAANAQGLLLLGENKEIREKEQFSQINEYLHIPDDEEVYGLFGYSNKTENTCYIMGITDQFLHYNSLPPSPVTTEKCEWIDFAFYPCAKFQDYKKGQPEYCISLNNADYYLDDNAISFLLKMRRELRKYLIDNSRTVRNDFGEKVSRLPEKTFNEVWNICKSFRRSVDMITIQAVGFHYFLLGENDKKDEDYKPIQEYDKYLVDCMRMGVPEEDTVIYCVSPTLSYARNYQFDPYRNEYLGLYITNSGIYWYDRSFIDINHIQFWDSKLYISWSDFKEISIDSAEHYVKLDNELTIYLGEHARLAYKILKKIQKHLIANDDLVLFVPDLEDLCISIDGYDYHISNLLESCKRIDIYSSENKKETAIECELADMIRTIAPDYEQYVRYINENDQNGSGFVHTLIKDTGTESIILLTEHYMIFKDTANKPMIIPYTSIIQLVVLEKGEGCLLNIKVYNNNVVSDSFVAIDKSCTEINIDSINERINHITPCKHGDYYRMGIGVSKDLGKAIELYKIAIESKESTEIWSASMWGVSKCYRELGDKQNEFRCYVELAKHIDLRAQYEYAVLCYNNKDVDFGQQTKYRALCFMDQLSKKRLWDSRDQMTKMIGDPLWLSEVQTEAEQLGETLRFEDILKKGGKTNIEHFAGNASKKMSNTAGLIKGRAIKLFGKIQSSMAEQAIEKDTSDTDIGITEKEDTCFCPYCGKKIKKGTKFCVFCGENITGI